LLSIDAQYLIIFSILIMFLSNNKRVTSHAAVYYLILFILQIFNLMANSNLFESPIFLLNEQAFVFILEYSLGIIHKIDVKGIGGNTL